MRFFWGPSKLLFFPTGNFEKHTFPQKGPKVKKQCFSALPYTGTIWEGPLKFWGPLKFQKISGKSRKKRPQKEDVFFASAVFWPGLKMVPPEGPRGIFWPPWGSLGAPKSSRGRPLGPFGVPRGSLGSPQGWKFPNFFWRFLKISENFWKFIKISEFFWKILKNYEKN